MPRQARLNTADTVYHITSRGNHRDTIYVDDKDRSNWLHLLGDICGRFNWRVHAFCQMNNHFHLVAETRQPDISAGMQRLNGLYTQRYNYRHATSGRLYQARFYSEIVDRQQHLLELMRYVVLNPVRAGLVATPGGWQWSSYAMTCDAAVAPVWLDTDWVLSQFSERRSDAVMAYRRFVADGCSTPGDRPAGPVPGPTLRNSP